MRDAIVISRESPSDAGLDLLFRRHNDDMHADTPPESIHMLPRAALEAPDVDFFVMRLDGRPIGMAALKRLNRVHGELKSMHILSEDRGAGLSRRLLDHLIAHARRSGLTRLSLETGIQPTFTAARGLYAHAGFSECPPFADYSDDPNSLFMTRAL
ncbi:GNAT family N-acetyltransferase [Paracoccus sp. (in: a-proteobacteria)]|uniref:GNAT family N-acetyltransferase n=1 Tax=Paracoccus sp. TaxID=267 RepID=UPI003A84DB09